MKTSSRRQKDFPLSSRHSPASLSSCAAPLLSAIIHLISFHFWIILYHTIYHFFRRTENGERQSIILMSFPYTHSRKCFAAGCEGGKERKRPERGLIKISFPSSFVHFLLAFFLPCFLDGWKMNVSLKRQLQRSLIKNKSVAFADSTSSGSGSCKSLKLLSGGEDDEAWRAWRDGISASSMRD